jgi:hypothetical protein
MTTSDAAMRALRTELGGTGGEGLEALNPEELEALAQALRDTKRRQSAALRDASEGALNHVPALLRGPIRKILG